MYESLEDEKLMALYTAGDELAFKELFSRYRNRVYGYLLKKARDERKAEDLFQRVFLKLHRSRMQFEKERLFAAWLFAICRNVLKDSYREQANEARMAGKLKPVSREAAETGLAEQEAIRQFEAAMASLPETQRRAIELRYGKNLSFSAIALELRTTESNARQILSRTLQRIKGSFK